MRKVIFVLILTLLVVSSGQQFHDHVDISTQCSISQFAVEYATYLQPPGSNANYTKLAMDALQINTTCSLTPQSRFIKSGLKSHRSPFVASECTWQIFVDGNKGNDNNPGTISSPLKTVLRAVAFSRGRSPSTDYYACINVRAGTYYFGGLVENVPIQTLSRVGVIQLTSTDSGLTIQAYNNEEVIFSGGTLLQPNWVIYKNTTAGTIYVTKVTQDLLVDWTHFNELYIDDGRAIRARYPNGDPLISDRHTNPTGLISKASKWLLVNADDKPFPTVQINTSSPLNNGTFYPENNMGVGGSAASVFDPPKNYWAISKPDYGGGLQYDVPFGMIYDDMSPNIEKWSRASLESGLINVYHGSWWGNWIYRLQSVFPKNKTILFGEGGFQEARGRGYGAEFYIDNVFEELDYPTEWWLDSANFLLYYMTNSSAPEVKSFVASQTPCILSLHGTQASPIRDVAIRGISFTQTSNTFMSPYLAPSGGDWSIHVGGTVFITGAVDCMIYNSTFSRLGSNGVIIYDYNQNVTVANSEFVKIGDSGVIIQGNVQGIDGVSSNTQPHDVSVISNIFHETGAYVRQSAPVFHSLARNTLISENVMFNVPRACININDGFGGGTVIQNNLLFNAVRDTNDHGPINTWDRQPYLVDNGNGPTLTPKTNIIKNNFVIMNYNSLYPVDHDDGSSWYDGFENFLVYGGDKSYLGHSKNSHDNLMAFTKHSCYAYHSIPNQAGWGENWSNNTCIVGESEPVYIFTGCETTSLPNRVPFAENNIYYLKKGNATVKGCTTQGKSVEFTIEEWQKFGYDIGSKVIQGWPSTTEVIEMALKVLRL